MGEQQIQATITVLIIDGQSLERRGLRSFLVECPACRLVGEASSGAAGAELCSSLGPDVVLLDLDLPNGDWTEAMRSIHAAAPGTKVIALTSRHNDELAYRAIEAGAIAYLLKDTDAAELARAISAAYRGHPTLAPEATETLVRSVSHLPPGVALTPREREVLTLLVRGLSNPLIAEELCISPSTVKFHVSSILAKLGTGSRAATAALAVQRHLVE